ncbi:DUF4265 domain-containing protein [Nibribacter ruber]|uniref:DUF4265 domain-containing protein n=1 Tax=Nibribacter ruber TaxID=2698458 RepID=A0A6P1NYU4_9BACT|nr:DUF4265 domain-containing protein [Nibribacter ruber]QHL86991.1 DUF4265 domain-containing protein [Nibribacter ruber]
MNEEGLEKIHIDLPNHWVVGGESMWAEPLGNDLFQIENVPFYAYGLNFKDIVRATSDSEELKPEIRELIKPSGRRTFRICFKSQVSREQQEVILESFFEHHVSYERADDIYVALDMKPEGDYQAVFDKLESYQEQYFIGFETCEARVEGSFDDVPEDDEDIMEA